MCILARNWWSIGLRGLFAVLFGLMLWIWPGPSLTALVVLFGAYFLVDGIFSIIAGVLHRKQEQRWWTLILGGALGVAAGLVTLVWPGITGLALLYVIAAWAIVTGVLEIVAAVRLRKVIEGEVLLGLAGAASVMFGLLIAIWPGVGALALAAFIGSYAVLFGSLQIALSLRLRKLCRGEDRGHFHPSGAAHPA